jgi:Membrane-bound metallopeptidase
LHRPRGTWLAALLAAVIFIRAAAPGQALAVDESAMSDEEIRELLEKSLNIAELDKEIGRIAGQRRETAGQVRALSDRIAGLETELDMRRERVGDVLRSWYTGERDALLAAILSSDSLSDLLAMLDYLGEMLSHDKFTINAYRKQREDWLKERERLIAEERRLAEIEENLRRQRERVIRLRAEVDGIIASSGDGERLRLLIAEWIAWWENTGLPEVERHFRALADAMVNLPAWLAERKDLVKQSGFTYTVRLPEDDLNEFLRDQNPLFESFASDSRTASCRRTAGATTLKWRSPAGMPSRTSPSMPSASIPGRSCSTASPCPTRRSAIWSANSISDFIRSFSCRWCAPPASKPTTAR